VNFCRFMPKWVVLSIVLSALNATIAPVPSFASTGVTAKADPNVGEKVLALAKEWFHRFQTGNIDRSQLDAASNIELTAEVIRQQEAALGALGKPTAFTYLGSDLVQGDKAYHFLVTFAGPDRIVESIALDDLGKIAGIDFATYTPSAT